MYIYVITGRVSSTVIFCTQQRRKSNSCKATLVLGWSARYVDVTRDVGDT